ncbi:hypothetical protein SISNIDRAFT_397570, partial [Sistotremastrum niveocremeum HHB9708]
LAPYPIFSRDFCSWDDILKAVQHPTCLWDCWGPGPLGSFRDISAIWTAWDSGRPIDGVGVCAPLRTVENYFGKTYDKSISKGHYASWRPSSNATARQQWNLVNSYIKQITKRQEGGRTVPDAIKILEEERANRTLNQFQKTFQVPKQK